MLNCAFCNACVLNENIPFWVKFYQVWLHEDKAKIALASLITRYFIVLLPEIKEAGAIQTQSLDS